MVSAAGFRGTALRVVSGDPGVVEGTKGSAERMGGVQAQHRDSSGGPREQPSGRAGQETR